MKRCRFFDEIIRLRKEQVEDYQSIERIVEFTKQAKNPSTY